MMNWEFRYRALVRRLVEIADANDHNPPEERIVDYDRVARAHEKTIELYPNNRGIDDDSLQDSLG